MKRLMLAALVGLYGLLPSPARATGRTVVLDLEASPGADRLATAITDQLRRQVAATPGVQSVPGKSLAEIRLIYGGAATPGRTFHGWGAKAAAGLKADQVLIGKVSPAGGGEFKVVLTLIEVAHPLRPKTLSERLSVVKTSGDALSQQVSRWSDQLLGRLTQGYLEVRCSVEGATVALDGQDAGTCSTRLRRLTVASGRHELEFRKAGHHAIRRVVQVAVNQTHREQVELPVVETDRRPVVDPDRRVVEPERRPIPDDAVTPPKQDDTERKPDKRIGWKAAFYSTLAVGVGVLVGSLVTGLKVKSLEKDKEDAIRASQQHGSPLPEVTDVDNACHNNNGNREVWGICQRGLKMARYTNILLGVGAGLVAVSMVFMWKAYLAKSKREKPRETTIRLTPELWGKGAGVSAAFEF
jgi:hypothetical protein